MKRIVPCFAVLALGLGGCRTGDGAPAPESTSTGGSMRFLESWQANLLAGGGAQLQGLVEVPPTGGVPRLVPRVPQGINPRILMLDLVWEPSLGEPRGNLTTASVLFEVPAGIDQVTIFGHGGLIDVPIE